MKKINLNSRLSNEKFEINVSEISTILDYLVVAGGRTYNVRETTAEILEKISAACDKPNKSDEPKTMTSKELFNELGIDIDETFESIFGFRPEDDLDTVAKKLVGDKKEKRKVRKIVRTPFGPIATWVEEE